jgi:hypothetical protein
MLSAAAAAQTEKIETDRPDQTESPYIVSKKWMQFEGGIIVEKLNAYATNFTIPTVLTKYGISKKTELRLITELSASDSKLYITNSTDITTPLQLGFKTSLFEEKGLLPKTSVIVHTALQNIEHYGQSGSNTTKEIAGNYRFTMQHTITKNISLGYNMGMEWEQFTEAPAYVYTVATGFNLSANWYAYIEAFGSIWKKENPENSVDAGLAYYLNDNFKLDISAGIGISKNAPDNYFAIGASFRFKTGK